MEHTVKSDGSFQGVGAFVTLRLLCDCRILAGEKWVTHKHMAKAKKIKFQLIHYSLLNMVLGALETIFQHTVQSSDTEMDSISSGLSFRLLKI